MRLRIFADHFRFWCLHSFWQSLQNTVMIGQSDLRVDNLSNERSLGVTRWQLKIGNPTHISYCSRL